MSHEHDSSYKYLFSAPEMVRDLILGFVPDEWLHSLDYSTLERVGGSFTSRKTSAQVKIEDAIGADGIFVMHGRSGRIAGVTGYSSKPTRWAYIILMCEVF